jgi:hypothetical protein
MAALWDVEQCCLLIFTDVSEKLTAPRVIILITEAEIPSGTSVNFYRSTQCKTQNIAIFILECHQIFIFNPVSETLVRRAQCVVSVELPVA